MWNRNLSSLRFAVAVGTSLTVSVLIVVGSLVSAVERIPVFLS